VDHAVLLLVELQLMAVLKILLYVQGTKSRIFSRMSIQHQKFYLIQHLTREVSTLSPSLIHTEWETILRPLEDVVAVGEKPSSTCASTSGGFQLMSLLPHGLGKRYSIRMFTQVTSTIQVGIK
jgi:hypothetical protein